MTPTPKTSRARLARLLLAALGAFLFGCGGGVGTGGTGSYGAAPIDGFGSIFVGGIEFDDSAATRLDEDGQPLADGELRLGMTVQVEGGPVSDGADGPTARAATVRLARVAVGPVSATDVAARTLAVLGQTVQVNAATVFDARLNGGLGALRPGDLVAVHALADAAGRPVATRIEPAAASEPWRLRGIVSALDSGARRLQVGAASFDYAAAIPPPGLAEGQLVSLRLAAAAGGGAPAVTAFDRVAAPADAARAEVEGLVTAAGARLRIGGLDVDTAAARIEPAPAALVAGAQAEVHGRLQNGTLVAETVRVLTPQQAAHRVYVLSGAVGSLDLAAARCVVRGVGVDFAGARFVGGSVDSLAAGVTVRVQGELSADGTRLRATQVEIR